MKLKSFTRKHFIFRFTRKTRWKKNLFILFTFSFLHVSAQEGITNIVNNNATLGGSTAPYGGIFIAYTSSQQRVIVTSSAASSPSYGPQDIDITLVDNNNNPSHDVFGIANGTLTPKDVIVDHAGYVVIVGKIVVTSVPGVPGYDRGFILRMNLSNFSIRTFATYDINSGSSGSNDPWFHQVLELNLSGSLYTGNRQMAVLASADSGGFRKDYIMLVDQVTLTLNSTTMIAMTDPLRIGGSNFDSRAMSSGMEGFRTMTETDGTNNSLAVSGAYIYSSSAGNVFGIYIVEFSYSSGTLSLANQAMFGSSIYLAPEWILPHDMIFEANGYLNKYPIFYVTGSKFEPGLGHIPCYFAYSFSNPTTLIYTNSINILSAPQNLILGQISSRMEFGSNNDILVGNNRGDFYTYDKTSGIAGYIKSVTGAFRPTQALPYGDFVYDNTYNQFYGVTQGNSTAEMQLFTMLPNNTDACCFTVNNASSTSFAPTQLMFSTSTAASGSKYNETLSTNAPTVTSETLCAYCANNTMSISGPDDVFCPNDEVYTFQGCSHSSSGYWEIIGPGSVNCSSKIVSSNNSSATINLSSPSPALATGTYTIRYIEDISSETGCLDVLAAKTFHYQACCLPNGTYGTVQESYKHSYSGKTLGVVVDNNDYSWVLQDLGSQEYSLSQLDDVGKILQSHRYKGTSTDAFTAVDFLKSHHNPSSPGVVVAGGQGNKLYLVETDGVGAVIRKMAYTISTCEACSVEVVNIVQTINSENDPDGYMVLINLKNTSTGDNYVHLLLINGSLIGVNSIRQLSINSSNTTFIAHRLFSYGNWGPSTAYMVLGTIIINGVKKGVIFNPKLSASGGSIGTPNYRISNNVYFDGRAIYDESFYGGYRAKYFYFGGSTDPTGFNMNANAAFLKTDETLATVYEKFLVDFHMHALDVLPASGNADHSVFLLQSRKYDNTGHYFYHLLELNESLNVVGNINTMLQYKNTSNDHTPYSAGKNLIAQTSDGGYVMAGQDETEYDFIVAKVEPNFKGDCNRSLWSFNSSNINGTVTDGLISTPSSHFYDIGVDKYDLPLEYICCADRNGATFSVFDILPHGQVFTIENGNEKGEKNYIGPSNSYRGEVVVPGIGAVPSSIHLLPNPSVGIFNIQFSISDIPSRALPNYNISVMDLTGRVVYNRNGLQINYKETFDLTDLANGVYLVQVMVGETNKFIHIIKN